MPGSDDAGYSAQATACGNVGVFAAGEVMGGRRVGTGNMIAEHTLQARGRADAAGARHLREPVSDRRKTAMLTAVEDGHKTIETKTTATLRGRSMPAGGEGDQSCRHA
jgi:hypothetical protein